MATRTISNAGGKWSETTAWAEGAVPTEADDVVATATSGELKIEAEAKCRSIDLTGYVNKLVHVNAIPLKVGTTTVKEGNVALKFPEGMTYEGGGSTAKIEFVSSSATQQTVDWGGKTTKQIVFNGAGGSWKYLSAHTNSNLWKLEKGTVDLGGKELTTEKVEFASASTRVFKPSNATITGTGTTFWSVANATGLTLEMAGSTIKATSNSASERVFTGGGMTYGTVEIVVTGTGAVKVEGANTFVKLKINKGRTVKFVKEVTQTVTEAFEATGAVAELITIESTEAAKAWVLKKTSGTVSCDFLKLKDSKAEGGASFYAGTHSENVSGNEGWKFEAPPGAGGAPVLRPLSHRTRILNG